MDAPRTDRIAPTRAPGLSASALVSPAAEAGEAPGLRGESIPTLNDLLDGFDAATAEPFGLPHDPLVKHTRDSMMALRTWVDLAAPALQDAFQGTADPVAQFRRLIDEAYETLGKYKDLYSTRGGKAKPVYAELKVDQKRDRAVEALERLKAEGIAALRAHLSTLSPEDPQVYAEDGLSRLFWGGVAGGPLQQVSGVENLQYLSQNLAQTASQRYQGIRASFDLSDPHVEEQFHDFRKAVRSLYLTHTLCPHISTPAQQALLPELKASLGLLGKVQDKLIALERANKKPAPGNQAKLMADIQKRWAAAQTHLEKTGFEAQIRTFLP